MMNTRDWLIGCGIKPSRDLENSLEALAQEMLLEQRVACGIMAGSAALHTQSVKEIYKACIKAVNVDEIISTNTTEKNNERR